MIRICCALMICFAMPAAMAQALQTVMVGPDQTPLLFDRLQAFATVVVATTPDGFEKNPAPVPGTNCVYLPLKVEAVLKGDLKPGNFRLDVHEGLPPLLAERDQGTPRRYLLAMQMDKGRGYLGGGMLYTDLARFLPTDAGLEKVAKAFVEAKDVSSAALLKLCADLLADQDVAASVVAEREVNEVLARLATRSDEAAWKAADQAALGKVVDRASAQVLAGKAMDSAPALLLAVAARKDNPAGLKTLDERMGEPVRAWLSAQVAAAEMKWNPDYQRSAVMKPAIDLLARLKDHAAKDLLVKLTQDQRWSDLRRPAYDALKEILPPEELKDIAPPRPVLPPGMRQLPGGLQVPDAPDGELPLQPLPRRLPPVPKT